MYIVGNRLKSIMFQNFLFILSSNSFLISLLLFLKIVTTKICNNKLRFFIGDCLIKICIFRLTAYLLKAKLILST